MTFARLRTADWVAMIAALAVLLLMAADWYSTAQGNEARRQERLSRNALPGEAGEIERSVHQQAQVAAEDEERNAWQADGTIDRVILFVLLATVVLALGAGFLRAAARRFEAPWTPSALAAAVAVTGALLVTYRIVQEPGLDDGSNVKAGAPLAVVALGAIALACARGLKHEEEGEPFRELPEPPEPAEPAPQ
jgi:hypothetical protein